MPIEQIRQALSEGDLEPALKAASALSKALNDSSLETTLIMLEARYNQNAKQQRMGTISAENYNQITNQIRFALISTLEDFRIPDGFAFDLSPFFQAAKPASNRNTATNPTQTASDVRILMLSANPSNTAKLQLEKEHSRIQQELNKASNRNQFDLEFKQAVTPSEFRSSILDFRPHLLHFSGHGELNDPAIQEAKRGVGRPSAPPSTAFSAGIILMDESKRGHQFVSVDYLSFLFETVVEDPEIPLHTVLFNACYSGDQAAEVSKHVEFVIGTSDQVQDDAAIGFAKGFYSGVTRQGDILKSVRYGAIDAMAYNEPRDRFVLFRNGEQIEF